MAGQPKKKIAPGGDTRSLLRSLPQARAAELIGKPAVWLRDHPEIGCRNHDGTYDGPALVAAVIRKDSVEELDDGGLRRRRLEAECKKVEAEARSSQSKADEDEGTLVDLESVRHSVAVIGSI